MDRKSLINELTNLDLKEKFLKRQLDILGFDYDKRIKLFNELKEVKKQKKEIKFKLQLIKELNK